MKGGRTQTISTCTKGCDGPFTHLIKTSDQRKLHCVFDLDDVVPSFYSLYGITNFLDQGKVVATWLGRKGRVLQQEARSQVCNHLNVPASKRERRPRFSARLRCTVRRPGTTVLKITLARNRNIETAHYGLSYSTFTTSTTSLDTSGISFITHADGAGCLCACL